MTQGDVVGTVCPYCQTPIAAGAEVVVCPDCGTTHHAECWRENGRCTTFGCDGRLRTNPWPDMREVEAQRNWEAEHGVPRADREPEREHRWPSPSLVAAVLLLEVGSLGVF